jgi:hypothetical protein
METQYKTAPVRQRKIVDLMFLATAGALAFKCVKVGIRAMRRECRCAQSEPQKKSKCSVCGA